MNELFEGLYLRLKKILGKDAPLVAEIKNAWNNDLFIRNFCSHDRRNYASSISALEVRKSCESWFDNLEPKFRCGECGKLVEYVKAKSQEHTQCPCGKLNLKNRE